MKVKPTKKGLYLRDLINANNIPKSSLLIFFMGFTRTGNHETQQFFANEENICNYDVHFEFILLIHDGFIFK